MRVWVPYFLFITCREREREKGEVGASQRYFLELEDICFFRKGRKRI